MQKLADAYEVRPGSVLVGVGLETVPVSKAKNHVSLGNMTGGGNKTNELMAKVQCQTA